MNVYAYIYDGFSLDSKKGIKGPHLQQMNVQISFMFLLGAKH